MAILISEGTNLDTLAKSEPLLAEGQAGEVVIYLTEALSPKGIAAIELDILAQGVILTGPIRYESRLLVVPFKKALAPLLIIAVAVGAVVAGIYGWQLFTNPQVPWWLWLVAGGALLYLLFVKDKTTTQVVITERRRSSRRGN